ncbi:rod shape-determining protein [Clostridium sp. LY3-2]|uniref:cell division protein FtsA n=1 Tax=Clostridium sp. LY3-2 TaxID=2942482 RepID=UPI0021528A8A|nr:cell division FtsA domain-containing protein [Clostridium sp. LY3-2]MCR6516019.1 rod shape-determining protein [Clostridium sp. LY3-2]
MIDENFEKKIIFSLDIGTRSIIGTVGKITDEKFEVLEEVYIEHEERAMIDGQIHDINLVAKVVNKIKMQLEEKLDITLKEVSIAAAGRFLRTVLESEEIEIDGEVEIDKDIVRSLELSVVKKAEDTIAKDTEGKLYCVGYSVKNYYLNSFVIGNLLGHKGERISADIISTFLPRSVVDSLYTVMDKVGLRVNSLTLEPIAAIEAVVPQKLRLLNIALVDIGAGTSDIAISSKESISAYGMVPIAGDEITEVIAQEYLVDFDSAEAIKRKLNTEEVIDYVDVLGLENSVKSEEVLLKINSIVRKLAEAIGEKILELNGNKAPSAVFLVGGGAHTPGLIDEISDIISLDKRRIGIKDRNGIDNFIGENDLGSAGVTVIGIALNGIKNKAEDFIDVILNNKSISMFNSHKHTILDVLLQAGIHSAMLINKNGKNLRFTLNGKKRILFGENGEGAKIKLNGKEANVDSKISACDKIDIEFAQKGKDAKAKVLDLLDEINSTSIYIDGKLINLNTIALINGELKELDTFIKENDDIKVIFPNTIGDIKRYILKSSDKLFLNEEELKDDYRVKEGENLKRREVISLKEEVKVEEPLLESIRNENTIKVIVNNEEVTLKGKEGYMFVDIFNFYDFDTANVKGETLILTLNGEKAAYTDLIKEKDIIEVRWS